MKQHTIAFLFGIKLLKFLSEFRSGLSVAFE